MNIEYINNGFKIRFCFCCCSLNKKMFVFSLLFQSLLLFLLTIAIPLSLFGFIISIIYFINFYKNIEYNDKLLKCFSIYRLIFSIFLLIIIIFFNFLLIYRIPFNLNVTWILIILVPLNLFIIWDLNLCYKFYCIINGKYNYDNFQINHNIQQFNEDIKKENLSIQKGFDNINDQIENCVD